MRFLLINLFIYFSIIILHLLFSRLNFSRKTQVNVLWALGLGGAVVYWRMTAAFAPTGHDIWSISLRGSSLFLFILLLFPYYIFFTNADYESPSQLIMAMLKKRGQCSYTDFLQELTPQRLIIKRLDDLRDEGFIGEQAGQYRLLAKGVVLTRCMEFYKIILGREIHG